MNLNPNARKALRMIVVLCASSVGTTSAQSGSDCPACGCRPTTSVQEALAKLEREWVKWSIMESPDDEGRIRAAHFLGVLYGRLDVEIPSWWMEILVRRAIGAENVGNLIDADERKYAVTGNFRHPRTAKIRVVGGRIIIQDARAEVVVSLDELADVEFASEGILPFLLQYTIDVRRKRAIVLVYHPALPAPSGWIKCVDIERSTEVWSEGNVGDFQIGEKRRRFRLHTGMFSSGCQLISRPCGCVFVFGAQNAGLYVQWYDRNGKTALARFRYDNERMVAEGDAIPVDDVEQSDSKNGEVKPSVKNGDRSGDGKREKR